ncbi:L-ascorbate metabolism protein UlaG (beta-lactamase superfamily) [Nitrobacteraceae bacterium AZCC 1564]
MHRLRWIIVFVASVLSFGAFAEDKPQPSQCLAVAQSLPNVRFVSLRHTAAEKGEVVITYAGHSTYIIETPGNVIIATDFSGVYTADKLPDVVTMNRAHSTHYTLNPDPRIKYVLHGWNDGDGAAKHALTVGDVFIRNVPTDIRGYRAGSESAMQKDGNSIFIFEVAGLCIGHLGHLHHPLDEARYAAIGRLDIVMVPIDGTYTLSLDGMSEITRRLRASIVLPMHRFSTPLGEFVARMNGQFEVEFRKEQSFSVSLDTLPKAPTIIILDGV